MNRVFFLFVVAFCASLESVEFVLFTQPKTATHLLIPILQNLTGKKVYWAEEYRQEGSLECSFDAAYHDGNSFYYSLTVLPWNREKFDLVWETTKKNGAFLHLHAPYTATMESYLRHKQCITFFIKRDPRDQLVSLLNHYKFIDCQDKKVAELQTDSDRLLYLIKLGVRGQTIHYMNWIHSDVCCALDFEKLMGEHGGVASMEDAMVEMRKIASALGNNFSNSQLERIYKKNFGTGWNFFKGKVGTWKDYFNSEHKAEIKRQIGDLLIAYGFEKDLDW